MHLADDPGRVVTLTLADARHRHGTWLAVFTHDDASPDAGEVPAPPPAERSIAPVASPQRHHAQVHDGDHRSVDHANGRVAGSARLREELRIMAATDPLVACAGFTRPAEVAEVATRIADALRGTVVLATGVAELRASIGAAVADGRDTAESLLATADAAMYRSKRAGTGRPVVHGAPV